MSCLGLGLGLICEVRSGSGVVSSLGLGLKPRHECGFGSRFRGPEVLSGYESGSGPALGVALDLDLRYLGLSLGLCLSLFLRTGALSQIWSLHWD